MDERNPAPTRQYLMAVFSYDPATGAITKRRGRGAGRRAEVKNHGGYLCVWHQHKCYRAHRLGWWFVTGEEPPASIDHINGDQTDNRFENLRAADAAIQRQNTHKPRSDSATGFLGVERQREKFRGVVKCAGRKHVTRRVATPEEAHRLYLELKRVLHPAFTG